MKRAYLPTLLILLALSGPVHARTWRVPSECPTISAGCDSATHGDTVLVAAGTYYSDSAGTQSEAWIVPKDGVALVSEDGPEVTMLVKCPSSAGGLNCVERDDCGSCYHAVEATTWGAVKALFR
jgi:hypothetical protein